MAEDLVQRFFNLIRPKGLDIIPDSHFDGDWTVVPSGTQGPNPDFTTQAVRCMYSPSGSYGLASRVIFYGLVVFAVIWRQVGWIANLALGIIMVYSSTAALHAIVLAVLRERLLPDADPLTRHFEVIRVMGTSVSGHVSFADWPTTNAMGDNSSWMPVVPMAWDVDPDSVLAVVGFAFLVFLPMQIWSVTLRKSPLRLIFWFWGLVLFVGSVCALLAEAYLRVSRFPQLRFCPPGFQDPLPLMNDGSQTVSGGAWDGLDRYHWNRTVQAHFMGTNGTPQPLGNICIYPCFDTTWPLRDPTEIQVFALDFGFVESFKLYYVHLLVVCFFFIVTSVSNLSIAIIMSKTSRRWLAKMRLDCFSEMIKASEANGRGSGTPGRPFCQAWTMLRFSWQRAWAPLRGNGVCKCERVCECLKRFLVFAIQVYFLGVFLYACVLIIPVCGYFLFCMEVNIWQSNPPGESFKHVGQWSTVAGLALTFIATVVGQRAAIARKVVACLERWLLASR